MKSVRNIVILGSTGSIGRSTLEVIDKQKDQFNVVGLAAGGNVALLSEQIRKYKPEIVALYEHDAVKDLTRECFVKGVKLCSGVDGVIKVATHRSADFVISAIVGAAGLLPTVSAIKEGKDIGLANKEVLVMAGELVIKEAVKKKVAIIPIDSEHSAIYQSMAGYSPKSIKKVLLTASGGPFRTLEKEDLSGVTVEEALKHPNWTMGNKISIDSATMMNKGLEVIEASWLFGVPPDDIEVLIHPQSIVHSMVEFVDSSVLAQLGLPDMRVPILYALNYGRRVNLGFESLDLVKAGNLTFEKPDFDKFPCLRYAYDAINRGGSLPSVLNAANEVAVQSFLQGET
ncbi:MAG: 1-deoxy-D-xylulose-5-phosphate reductoisomerase, partial [Nitrospinota bacterium]